jgi:acyl CoA:acetate/3-ketoacid CoA transferase alpha subunit
MENSDSVRTIFRSGVRDLWPGIIIVNSLTCVQVYGLEMQCNMIKEFICSYL